MRHFDDPASGFLAGVRFEFAGLLPTPFDMGDVAVLFDDRQGGSAGGASVSAKVFASPLGWQRSLDDDGLKHRRQLREIMPMGTGHDERQRDATTVHQQMALAPIFRFIAPFRGRQP